MYISLENIRKAAEEKQLENKKFFQKLKKNTPKNLDLLMQDLHEEVFEHTDCLACANCCKSASPIITEKDIERISKHLRIKEVQFVEKYLYRDTDDFMAFKQTPCPFLDIDNHCLIYEYRPKACADYPHTNRRKFIQITNLTLKNAEICPAVFEIVEKLKEQKF